ncbi:MAG TPA: hypothetical protein VIQ51_12715 [Chryseosolibacter sp.]|jgi:hypothetical protein
MQYSTQSGHYETDHHRPGESNTFWTWTILDINRLLLARLFYHGDAPVEDAWSARSKYVRKRWEQAQSAGSM